jgi:hypothetical protein
MKHVTLFNQIVTGRLANVGLHEKDLSQDQVVFLGPTGVDGVVTVKGCQNEGLMVEIRALRAKLVTAGVL